MPLSLDYFIISLSLNLYLLFTFLLYVFALCSKRENRIIQLSRAFHVDSSFLCKESNYMQNTICMTCYLNQMFIILTRGRILVLEVSAMTKSQTMNFVLMIIGNKIPV